MENTQNHGRSVGKVTTTFNGEKIQVEVFEDRSVILPDGTVRKVKQEVVDALLANSRRPHRLRLLRPPRRQIRLSFR